VKIEIHVLFYLPFILSLGSPPVLTQQNATGGSSITRGASADKPRSFGSSYVELDSWVYPAIERLAALGYISNEFLGMRPWTRIECAHLILEAGDAIDSNDSKLLLFAREFFP
jgi:hypothetical protein